MIQPLHLDLHKGAVIQNISFINVLDVEDYRLLGHDIMHYGRKFTDILEAPSASISKESMEASGSSQKVYVCLPNIMESHT
jgi:hypothetical protein